jgi:hypothetical protein
MDLQQYIEDNSGQLRDKPGPLQALKALNETVTEALLVWIKGESDQAGQHLLNALPQLLVAMGALGVNPGYAKTTSLNLTSEARLIRIDGNRVEVRVDNQLRGSWSIWSVADLKEVCRLAEEFDCNLVYSFTFMSNTSSSKLEETMGRLAGSRGRGSYLED